MKAPLPILVATLAWLAVSCKVGPDYSIPTSRVASQWLGSTGVASKTHRAAEESWWRSFNDPVLDRLVDSAFRDNLTLQVAGLRILEARAQLNRSIGNLFPQQQALTGQLDYNRLNDGVVTAIPGIKRDYLSDQVLFAASWEMDFWGKYRRAIESERASYQGAIADYDNALVTLIADVASSYVNIRTLEERLGVARKNLGLQQESLRIARVQFGAGETSERDVQQATTQLGQTEAQIPRFEESLRQTKNGLAVLLGRTPGEVDRQVAGPNRIPAAPASVVAGIPKDLLRRRPDVRAAGLAAASKSALIGVAEAAMYPSFSLTGEFGAAGNNEGSHSLADIFNWESRALGAGAGFVFPILNYGRLINQVRVQDAQFQAAVLRYQNTVLSAQREVEDGLAAFANQQRAVTALSRAAAAAGRSAELAVIQYKGGQTDFTTVVSAQQNELAVDDSLASTRGNVVLGFIAVYRALGGGWQIRRGHDVISDEVKTGLAGRTHWGRMLEPAHHLPPDPPAQPAGGTQ